MIFLESGNTLHCFFSGRLDGSVCSVIEPALHERVTGFIKNRETIGVVFDLSDVVYVSSAFLRICLIHCKLVGKNNFFVNHTSEDIHKVFHISGFAEIMHVT
jgi:anti-anti-sigma factor